MSFISTLYGMDVAQGILEEADRCASSFNEVVKKRLETPSAILSSNLSVEEAAKVLGVTADTIRRECRKSPSGRFPNAFKNGNRGGWKIPYKDIEHYRKASKH